MHAHDHIWPRRNGIVHQAVDDGQSRIYVNAPQEREIAMIDHDLHRLHVGLHLDELRARAAADRLAREARGPRPLRRRVGRLLIAMGKALQGQPLDTRSAENALAVGHTRL